MPGAFLIQDCRRPRLPSIGISPGCTLACLLGGLRVIPSVTAGPIVTRAGASPGAPGWPRSASLGLAGLPPAPVYLAALGPQMLRLAGEIADGALLNWATPERIAVSRARVNTGALRAGRDPGCLCGPPGRKSGQAQACPC